MSTPYIYETYDGGRDHQTWRAAYQGDAMCQRQECTQPATWEEHEIDDYPGNYTHDCIYRCDQHVNTSLYARPY